MLITGYFHIITFLSLTCYSTITTLWLRWSCSSQFLYNSSFADKRTSSDKLIYNHQYHWNLAGHALYHCYWVRRRKTWLLQHNFIFLLLLRQRRKKIQCSLIHKKKITTVASSVYFYTGCPSWCKSQGICVSWDISLVGDICKSI